MNNSTLPYWLSLMVLFVASYGGWKWYQVQQFEASREVGGIAFDGPPLEEFELTERSGQPFRSADMRGKVWVTTFFFASCPGQCPRLNANIKQLHDLPELKDVTWVSITVDPDNDTLEVLNEYADRYQADPERWLFCRGEFDYIKRVGEEIMQLEVTWRGHKDYAIVIDRAGKVRGMFDATSISQSQKLRLLLLDCLAEEAPTNEIAQAARPGAN
ncbi:MAG: SCO family protein [Bythopirellula sp.]|nr:SCO family protein [Bythopirellula sp.]